MKRNEDSLRNLLDNIKCTNNHSLEIQEEEEREKGPEKILEEIIAENFPNMGKEIVNQPSPGSTRNPRKDNHKTHRDTQ